MKATVLVDNISHDNIIGEWGLSIFIEYQDKKILLDTGASGLFLRNAEKLGIDMKAVDFGVLSHAHYDHANGMEDFFYQNLKAKFYLREGSKENTCKFPQRILSAHRGYCGYDRYGHRRKAHRVSVVHAGRT